MQTVNINGIKERKLRLKNESYFIVEHKFTLFQIQ